MEITEQITELLDKPKEILLVEEDGKFVEPPPPTPSPTAVKMDTWSRTRGKNWLKAQKEVTITGDKKLIENTAADMLACAWEPVPYLVDDCEEPRRLFFMKTLFQTPEYVSLHRQTQLNILASELAAISFTQQWVAMKAVEEPQDELDKDAQAQQFCNKAAGNAKQSVQQLSDTMTGLGIGDSGEATTMPIAKIRKIFQQVKDNEQLRRIMELAGKFRRYAQSLQASKACHGDDEVVGIEIGDDLSRICPSELAELADEDLELDFLRRYAEAELQLEEVSSIEAEIRGPIVVVLDESGSMSGEPIAHGKAIVLALAWVARHQKRHVSIVSFSDGKKQTGLVIQPGENKDEELLKWLGSFQAGGTDPDVPFQEVPKNWAKLGCPKGKTDMLVITDAAINIPTPMMNSFNAWKKEEQVKVQSIIMASDAGQLKEVSDQHWLVGELKLETQGVADFLSI
jgi:uncharacterized protein with von Willebrand factor type A (vWA) domain